jgi:hypothetical protein
MAFHLRFLLETAGIRRADWTYRKTLEADTND